MAAQVFKHEIPVSDDPVDLELVRGSEIVHAEALLATVVTIWTLHDPANVGEWDARRFRIAGTGQPLTDNAIYRATVVNKPSGLVWHVFEVAAGEKVS